MLAPHHVFIVIAQFGARHWPAIIIVAAFLWIPRVGSGGASDQRTKGSHALAMESWLHQVPLLEPGFPVIGNESLAE